MPMAPPRICGCGHKIASGERCPCEVRRKAEHDKRRPTARQRGYGGRWEAERAAYLKVHRTCARCSSAATVVDHIIPHRQDQKLFWSRSNWQPLCTHHHSSAKQSEERRAKP